MFRDVELRRCSASDRRTPQSAYERDCGSCVSVVCRRRSDVVDGPSRGSGVQRASLRRPEPMPVGCCARQLRIASGRAIAARLIARRARAGPWTRGHRPLRGADVVDVHGEARSHGTGLAARTISCGVATTSSADASKRVSADHARSPDASISIAVSRTASLNAPSRSQRGRTISVDVAAGPSRLAARRAEAAEHVHSCRSLAEPPHHASPVSTAAHRPVMRSSRAGVRRGCMTRGRCRPR